MLDELPIEIVREIVMNTKSLNDFINILASCKYVHSAINSVDMDKKIKMHAKFVTKPTVNIKVKRLTKFIRVQTLPNGKMHGKCIWFDSDDTCTYIKIIGKYSKGKPLGKWRFFHDGYSAHIVYK